MSTNNQQEKYIIVKLSDAKLLESWANSETEEIRQPEEIKSILKRFEEEEGADIEDIVKKLKGVDFCHACVVESQQRYCVSHDANKLGRRLKRLVDRANGIIPPGNQEVPEEPKKEEVKTEQKNEPVVKPPEPVSQVDSARQKLHANNLVNSVKTYLVLKEQEMVPLTLKNRHEIVKDVTDIADNWRSALNGRWRLANGEEYYGRDLLFYISFDQSTIHCEASPKLIRMINGNADIIFNS